MQANPDETWVHAIFCMAMQNDKTCLVRFWQVFGCFVVTFSGYRRVTP